MMKETMKNLPEFQRPYEKCIRDGEGALSDSELLAVILRTGTRECNSLELADQVLYLASDSPWPGLTGLFHLSLSELMKIRGIGKVKAIQLKCIGELSKRIACTYAKPQISFHDPSSIAAYYMEKLRHEEVELLYLMMTDSQNHLLGEQLLSKGTVRGAMITPREVFVTALKYHAVGLVLVHNHPGGEPAPSENDISLTERICHAGRIVGIELLDHIIIGDQKFISFRNEGLFHQFTK